ncbi:CBO0543 family protein [Herbivorax sp. ANBcel31]|uniref:CBO0543 family protein n=1 Tax=Herbivorax sp. ANBcel31 TaxID=3069754 RepID=UPI0027B70A12|nr:CBO0543 family protein [Herbivorax sp. ANBcel31]MDQ2085567.1 CBO0543 family protein [Herbivorax sp. ANBcel31]
MEWIIRFTAVWILFLVIIDWKELKINIWSGVFSIVLQIAMDTVFINNGFYKIENPVISIWGSSLFFIIGPVFVIGVLISQYQPSKRWAQILYVFLLAVVYDFEEYLLTIRKELIYTNWNFLSSVIINFILMMSISWFSIVVLKRGRIKEK